MKYFLSILLGASFSLHAMQKVNNRAEPSSAPPAAPANEALLAPVCPCPGVKETGGRGNVIAKASGLVWQSKIWGLEFAEKDFIPIAPNATTTALDLKTYVSDFAWRPGFKIDAGYQLPRDGWDIDTRWTFYQGEFTHLKRDFTSQIHPSGIGIVPLWYYPFFSTTGVVRYSSARSDWELNFNSIDVELGRASFFSHSLPLRLAVGAKGTWASSLYQVHYRDGTTINTTDILGNAITQQLIASRFAFGQHSWALGPRANFNSEWPILWGFNLVANGAFSLLYSSFHTTTRFDNTSLNTATGAPINDSLRRTETFHLLTPVLEAQLGFDWGMCFGKNHSWGLDLLIAYEMQYWWSQNHVRRNDAGRSPGATFDARGDLQMHGLTSTLRFDF